MVTAQPMTYTLSEPLEFVYFTINLKKEKLTMLSRIGNLLKKGLGAMAGFAGIMFAFVGELGFLTRNRQLTVLIAFAMVAAGLTVHMTLQPVFFYGYIALIFAAGLVLKGYNSARAGQKELEQSHLGQLTS
jgi:hypothetical protein